MSYAATVELSFAARHRQGETGRQTQPGRDRKTARHRQTTVVLPWGEVGGT